MKPLDGCICKHTIEQHNRICTEAIAQDKLVLGAVIIIALVVDTELINAFA